MTREDLYYDEYFECWELSPKEMDEFENTVYNKGRADAIDEYKEQLLENLISLKDRYFDLAKGTKISERYTHLKRMDTADMIIEMVKIKAEELKEQKK